MNSDQFKAQARNAYERGRLISAFKYLWFIIPVVLISLCTCTSAGLPLVIGCVLAVSVVALKWRGEEYGFAVVPGLMAGAVAFSIPLTLHLLGICCHNNLEVLLCTLSGALGGVVLGLQIKKTKRPNKMRALGLAVIIAAATASLGCLSLGFGAISGLIGSMAVAALSSYAIKIRS